MVDLTLLEKAEKFFTELPDEKIIISDNPYLYLKELCRGRTIVFSGTHYAQNLKEAGFEVWCGIEAEPASETVEKMADFLKQAAPDTVVAFGGGSVIDAAKAALLMNCTGFSLDKLFGVNQWSNMNPGKKLPHLIAVPTTSGTGSEATPYSNIVVKKANVKKLIVEKESIPAAAIISPELTATMPTELTRATGCDALAHLLEGFLNVNADSAFAPVNLWAKTGIELVVKNLSGAMQNIPEARRAMAYASLLGGMTIRYKSTGLPHLCSFSWFGRIAHGDAVAVLLPECWKYYLANEAVAARTMELSHIFPGETPLEVIGSFENFLDSVGLPGGLSAWSGIDADLIERTARSGAENRMKLELAPHPVPLEKSYDILKALIKLSL